MDISNIAPTSQDLVGERVTEALPALQTLFLEAPLPQRHLQILIEQFTVVRRLAGSLIVLGFW